MRSLVLAGAAVGLVGLGAQSANAGALATTHIQNLGDLSPNGIGDFTNEHLAASTTPFVWDYAFTLSSNKEETSATLNGTDSVATGTPNTNDSFILYSGTAANPGSAVELAAGVVNIDAPGAIQLSIPTLELGAGSYFLQAIGTYDPSHSTAKLDLGGSVTVNAVPEVSTWAMMVLGFGLLGFAGYRSSRRSESAAA